MTNLTLPQIQTFMEEQVGQTVLKIEFMGSGATSSAWLINCPSDNYVLRVTYASTNRPMTYRSEFTILHALRSQGLPVPEPIINSFQNTHQIDQTVVAWTITRQVDGTPLLKRKITPQIAEQLGEFLRQLHRLPVSQFGRLVQDDTQFLGQDSTPIQGLCNRLCWAKLYPYDGTQLSEHYIAELSPDLLKTIEKFETQFWKIPEDDSVELNHSDWHGEHIFTRHNQLVGVIDFGTAFIATCGWDFASLAHFHGWEATRAILKSYTQQNSLQSHILIQSQYLAVVLALYKLQKEKGKNRPKKTQTILQFLVNTIDTLKLDNDT